MATAETTRVRVESVHAKVAIYERVCAGRRELQGLKLDK